MEPESSSATGIMISSGAVGAICGVLGAWLKSHFGTKAKIDPCPLPIEGEISKKQCYVTTGEFNQWRVRIENDMASLRTEIQSGNAAVIRKLEELDAKSEKRACDLNQRIDPMISQIASNREAIDFLKRRGK